MNTCTSNACQQGRKACPTPEACELPIQYADDEPIPSSFEFVLLAIGFIVVVALISFIAGYTS